MKGKLITLTNAISSNDTTNMGGDRKLYLFYQHISFSLRLVIELGLNINRIRNNGDTLKRRILLK